MIDVKRFFEAYGYDHDDACDADTAEEFMVPFAQGIFVGFPFANAYATFEEMPIAFGFAHCEIESHLTLGTPDFFVWVDKDGTEIAEQAAADPTWAEFVEVSTFGDFTIVDWGHNIDSDRITPLRHTGGTLMIADNVVARVSAPSDPTRHSDNIQRIVDPTSVERLIDQPHVRSIIEQLEATGAYQILLKRPSSPLGPYAQRIALQPDELGHDAATWDLIVDTPRLGPWSAMGYGSAVSPQHGPVAVIAIGHASSSEAEVNEAQFVKIIESGYASWTGTAWGEQLQVVDIETDGAMLFITLAGLGDRGAFEIVSHVWSIEDNLFAIEDPLE